MLHCFVLWFVKLLVCTSVSAGIMGFVILISFRCSERSESFIYIRTFGPKDGASLFLFFVSTYFVGTCIRVRMIGCVSPTLFCSFVLSEFVLCLLTFGIRDGASPLCFCGFAKLWFAFVSAIV